MLFADDATICATPEEQLQTIITTFDETLTEFGLELATQKTKIMAQRNLKDKEKPEPKKLVQGKTLKCVLTNSNILVNNCAIMQLSMMKSLGESNKHLLLSPKRST